MAATADGSDFGTGFGVVFGLLAAGAAVLMLLTHGLLRAYGFGAALLLGALLVVSLHIYG